MLSFFSAFVSLERIMCFLHTMLKLKMNVAEFYFLKKYGFSKLEGGNFEILKFVWTKSLGNVRANQFHINISATCTFPKFHVVYK